MRFNLPDRDVFAIDASTLTSTASFTGVGTTIFNMVTNPVSGALYVSNTEARNEVRFEGPGVFGGYLNDTHNKGAFVEPGWVNSGDLGRLDADGYLWITGRAKDLVIRGGHNIDPAPIEDIMFQHPAVGLAAVVGQPDAYAGELPIGYVQLKPGASVKPGELEDWVRERTPERAAVPVQIIPIDPMPLTGVGKVFKPQLRWDAAKRVFTGVLSPLRERGVDCTVDVGAHGSHGSIATVTLAGAGRRALKRSSAMSMPRSSILVNSPS